MRDLKAYTHECHETARSKGWWDDTVGSDEVGFEDMVAPRLMLVVSEVSEALECLRVEDVRVNHIREDGKPEGFASELADVVIRVFDLAGHLGIGGKKP